KDSSLEIEGFAERNLPEFESFRIGDRSKTIKENDLWSAPLTCHGSIVINRVRRAKCESNEIAKGENIQ
ncbi:MAG: hypothetical protein RL730_151, partial [Actinomycetota bacterium]